MEPARGEPRWLVLDEAHVPALGSEAGSFDYGGQAGQAAPRHAARDRRPSRPVFLTSHSSLAAGALQVFMLKSRSHSIYFCL